MTFIKIKCDIFFVSYGAYVYSCYSRSVESEWVVNFPRGQTKVEISMMIGVPYGPGRRYTYHMYYPHQVCRKFQVVSDVYWWSISPCCSYSFLANSNNSMSTLFTLSHSLPLVAVSFYRFMLVLIRLIWHVRFNAWQTNVGKLIQPKE